MPVLILNEGEITELLPMADCIEVMEDCLAALARGEAVQPLRSKLPLPDGSGLLGLMPGYYAPAKLLGLKAVSVMPGNHGTRFDSHQGVVALFEAEHGRPVALLDASSITAIRTAAVSGVATRRLAREDAGDLAILGSGVQARTHLEAMAAVRRLRRVRVWSRNAENVRRFAGEASRRYGLAIEAAAGASEAVAGADLICTCTSAVKPVLQGAWIAAGAHVNAVGSSMPRARELDGAAVARARIFVDRWESAIHEAGDLLLAQAEGALGDDPIEAEIGELLIGAREGRTNDEEITLFESLGLAVEDLAAGERVVREARRRGLGIEVELGGVRAET